jgi:hypothetical protein
MRDNAADRKRETKRDPSSSHIRILHVSQKAPRSMRRGKVLGQQQNVRATDVRELQPISPCRSFSPAA